MQHILNHLKNNFQNILYMYLNLYYMFNNYQFCFFFIHKNDFHLYSNHLHNVYNKIKNLLTYHLYVFKHNFLKLKVPYKLTTNFIKDLILKINLYIYYIQKKLSNHKSHQLRLFYILTFHLFLNNNL